VALGAPGDVDAVDRVLRGDATRPSILRDTGTVAVQATRLAPLLLLLGATYGAFMGLFALINRADPEPMQLVASIVKVPSFFRVSRNESVFRSGNTFPST
jgi:hypothetical protein